MSMAQNGRERPKTGPRSMVAERIRRALACIAAAMVATLTAPPAFATAAAPGSLDARALKSAALSSATAGHFEANPSIEQSAALPFVARGPGYGVAVGAREALFMHQSRLALRMHLVGASFEARARAEDPLPGSSNYYIGNDPKQWRTGVARYGAVRVRDVYPGIDVVYRDNPQGLEYDFVIAAAADPRPIRLAFDGARSLRIDATGNLVTRTAAGDIVHHTPKLYQEIGTGRRPVRGRFVITGAREARFALGPYDQSRPLVIDPSVGFSTYLGGSGFSDSTRADPAGATGGDAVNGVAVDSAGAAYVTGTAGSYDFISGPGCLYPPVSVSPTPCTAVNPAPGPLPGHPNNSESVAFVVKFSSSGAIIYATFLSGTTAPNGQNTSFGEAIAVDSNSNAYVVGGNSYSDFPQASASFGTHSCASASAGDGGDAFVAELSRAGTLVYSGCIGGSSYDEGDAIAVGPVGASGNADAYIAGVTQSTDLQFVNAYQRQNNSTVGGDNAFIAHVVPPGASASLGFLTYYGGNGNDGATGLAYFAGEIYVTGNTTSTNFPTANPSQPDSGGLGDAFVAALNASTGVPVYSTYFGGAGNDFGQGIAVDAAGNAYVTGGTSSSGLQGLVCLQCAPGASESAFIAKFSPTGAVSYSTYLGGTTGADNGAAIGVDAAGGAHVLVNARSTDLPMPATSPAAPQPSANPGQSSFYVAKIAPNGGSVAWATYWGNPPPANTPGDDPLGLALTASGSLYVVGAAVDLMPITAGATPYRNAATMHVPNGAVLLLTVAGTSIALSGPAGGNLTATLTPALSCSACVQFLDNSTLMYGPYDLMSGTAQLPTSVLPAGNHSIVAQYTGSAADGASASSAVPVTVGSGSSGVAIPGGGGGGCALATGSGGPLDISLLALAAAALGGLHRRAAKAKRRGKWDDINPLIPRAD
jgi:hypothetical protein